MTIIPRWDPTQTLSPRESKLLSRHRRYRSIKPSYGDIEFQTILDPSGTTTS